MTHLLLALLWSKFGMFALGTIFGATGGYKIAAKSAKARISKLNVQKILTDIENEGVNALKKL